MNQSKVSNHLDSFFSKCVLKYKWEKIVPHYYVFDNVELINNFVVFRKNVDRSKRHYMDSFYELRTEVKVPPQNEYWNGTVVTRNKELERFWGQYGPQIMYTFDFILYSNNDVYDNFWFLMSYLKELVMNVPNPFTLAVMPNHVEAIVTLASDIAIDIGTLKSVLDTIRNEVVTMKVDIKKNTMNIKKLEKELKNIKKDSENIVVTNSVTEKLLNPNIKVKNTDVENDIKDGNKNMIIIQYIYFLFIISNSHSSNL